MELVIAAGIAALAPTAAVLVTHQNQNARIDKLEDTIRLLRQELAEAKLANVILKSAK